MKRWVYYGIGGAISGVLITVFEYVHFRFTGTQGILFPILNAVDDFSDGLVHSLGRALGVLYGYVVVFPNRAIQLTLSFLGPCTSIGTVVRSWCPWFISYLRSLANHSLDPAATTRRFQPSAGRESSENSFPRRERL